MKELGKFKKKKILQHNWNSWLTLWYNSSCIFWFRKELEHAFKCLGVGLTAWIRALAFEDIMPSCEEFGIGLFLMHMVAGTGTFLDTIL